MSGEYDYYDRIFESREKAMKKIGEILLNEDDDCSSTEDFIERINEIAQQHNDYANQILKDNQDRRQ